MYSDAAIQKLMDRIGWDDVRQPSSKTLTEDNLRADSRNRFSRYNALAIAEVVEEVMPVSNADTATVSITNDVLNAELYSLKEKAALKCLGMVFDSNQNAGISTSGGQITDLTATDWSTTITGKVQVLDELYGLCMASLVLDMCINNTRSNGRQRRVFDSGQVKIEQDGLKDEAGNLISPGISQKIAQALKNVNKILFPQATKRTVIRNASNMW